MNEITSFFAPFSGSYTVPTIVSFTKATHSAYDTSP